MAIPTADPEAVDSEIPVSPSAARAVAAAPPMIYEVSGDILLTSAQVLAHGVAPNDHFDSGLALSLRERWPSMAKDFRHYAHQEHPEPGSLWFWGGAGGVQIYSLLTQDGSQEHGARPGRATLQNVRHALKALAKDAVTEDVQSIALPRLATGVGGLRWDEVKPVVEEILGRLDIPVYVYTRYVKDAPALEPRARKTSKKM